VEASDWVSLSILADIIAGTDLRYLPGAVQVPSVLLKVVGDKITYLACMACNKGVYENKSCLCTTVETKVRFKADLRMEDDTYQLNTVAFDTFISLVKIFADGDKEKETPEYYHDNAARVEAFSMAIEAMPCTVLVSFEPNPYKEKIEMSLKAVEITFHKDQSKIRHPMKQILRSSRNFGKTSTTPPCAVKDTSFEEGAGVTLVPGGTAQKFRALLIVMDKQATTERVDDGSPAVRCTRKVCCALRDESDETTYTLNSVGPISFATQLTGPRKGETLHAIVAWRGKEELVLLAFMTAAVSMEDALAFKVFFALEAKLTKAFHEGQEPISAIGLPEKLTPKKRHTQALEAARQLATPEAWAKRNRGE
jgi:hypothetical protein